MIGLGRVSEVTRDEIKFTKFIQRLRNKFCQIFDRAMEMQLVLKGICTREEWLQFKEFIHYDFIKDNNYIEMRDAEVLRERLNLIMQVDPFTGKYYSQEWIKKNVLRLTDAEIEEMQKQMDKEQAGPALAPPPETQPVDNTQDDASTTTESATPQLDAEVDKYSLK
jgi:UTP:GlnB (protein PII) uridylyltransferase